MSEEGSLFGGGRNATTPFMTHLAHGGITLEGHVLSGRRNCSASPLLSIALRLVVNDRTPNFGPGSNLLISMMLVFSSIHLVFGNRSGHAAWLLFEYSMNHLAIFVADRSLHELPVIVDPFTHFQQPFFLFLFDRLRPTYNGRYGGTQ